MGGDRVGTKGGIRLGIPFRPMGGISCTNVQRVSSSSSSSSSSSIDVMVRLGG